MNKILIFLSFVLLSISLSSSVKALDVIATNGSAVAIQEAVNLVNTSGGGTVYIPEGDFLFNPTEDGAVKIPGGVNLVGAGKDKTILRNIEPVPFANWSWGYFFSVDGSKQNGKSVHLSGFTIIGFRELYPDNESRTRGIIITQVKDFVVSEVKIKDTGGSGIAVIGWRGYGDVITRGVITHCDFINTNGLPMGPGAIAYGPNVLGYGVQVDGFGEPEAWIDDISQVLGKYDYGQPVVYIEDCYFSRWRHCIASNQVGHYVSRYNIFDEYTQGFGDVDAHGAGYGNHGTGTRAIEVYNNTFMTPTPADSWTMATVFHRGGGGVYFNNTVKSGRGAFVYFSNDGTEWNPRSEVEKYFTNDIWIWNNNISSGVTTIIKYDPEGLIIEGVNYHLNAPTFNYTPYPYPHPLTLESSNLSTVSGILKDNNNQPVQANVIVYQNGTNTIIKSAQTNSSGHYSLQVPNGTYDIQFNLTNFFIQNYSIKLNSVNITNDKYNIIESITGNQTENEVSIVLDINNSQKIEIYNSKKPSDLKKNGTSMRNVSSLIEMNSNTWLYNPSENKTYMIINTNPKFTIYKVSSTYYAKDENDNAVQNDTNAAILINDILANHLTAGRNYKEEVSLEDNINLTNYISIPSYTILNIRDNITTDSTNIPLIEIMGSSSSHKQYVEIHGGLIQQLPTGPGYWPVWMNYADNVTIDSVDVEGSGSIKIDTGCSGIIVQNSRLILMEDTSNILIDNSSHIRIINNYISGVNGKISNGIHPQVGSGGLIDDLLIQGNEITLWGGSGGHGCYISRSATNVQIINNNFHDPNPSSGNAVRWDARGGIIRNNTIHDLNTSACGVLCGSKVGGYCNDTIITDNNIYNISIGIYIMGDEKTVGNVTVQGNAISNCSNTGILTWSNPGFAVQDSLIKYNNIDYCDYGIKLGTGTINCTVTENTLTACNTPISDVGGNNVYNNTIN